MTYWIDKWLNTKHKKERFYAKDASHAGELIDSLGGSPHHIKPMAVEWERPPIYQTWQAHFVPLSRRWTFWREKTSTKYSMYDVGVYHQWMNIKKKEVKAMIKR